MSVRRSLGTMLAGNAGFFVIQFGASLVLARLLTPAEMGVYAASVAVVYVVTALTTVGLPGWLVRERELTPDKIGSVYALTLMQSALLGGGLLLLADPMGDLARDARVARSVEILALFAAVSPVTATLSGLLQRRMRFDLVTLIGLTNIAVSAGATIALAYAGWGWRSMPWGTGAGALTSLALALVIQRGDRAPLSLRHARAILGFGSRLLAAALIVNAATRLPDILLTRASGAAATGLYSRGAGLVDVFTNTILRSFQRVMQSQFARDRDAGVGLGPGYARISRVVTGLFWPAFAVLGALASPVIGLLYGERWLAAAPVLAIIGGAAAVQMVVACRTEVLITVGRERELPRIEAVRGVIGVAMFAYAAQYGLVWAAATRVLDAAVAVALYAPGIARATGLGWRAMARAFARSAVVAVAAAAPAVAWMSVRGWPATLPVLELATVLAASGVAWLAALALTRHMLWEEMARAGGPLRRRLGWAK